MAGDPRQFRAAYDCGVAKQRTRAPERADALADVVLRDHDGRDVRLGDLWSERPVAMVWLRHYG
jgi:hypothetical protein